MASSPHSSPLVLVHGAWHDQQCWATVAQQLAARGITVSCPDLPGHGSSTLAIDKVTLKQYVAAVVLVLEAATEPVVLVGHSMAGMVVTAAACQMPHKVRSVVYLCAYLPLPGQSVFELIALNRGHEPLTPIELALELSADKRSCSIDADQIIPLFYSDVTDALAASLQQTFATQASLPLSSAVRFDQTTFNTLNTVYICCTRDKVIPLHHQRRMLARQPCKTLLQIEADHSPFVSCPQQLTDVLAALAQP